MTESLKLIQVVSLSLPVLYLPPTPDQLDWSMPTLSDGWPAGFSSWKVNPNQRSFPNHTMSSGAVVTMRKIIHALTLVLALGLSGPALAGPFEDGVAAYAQEDYATALRLWLPLADQGNAKAQRNLGIMYQRGRGVPQDYAQAQKWFTLAAVAGDAYAVKSHDEVAAKMTPAPIAEAQNLASVWKPKAEK